MEYPYESLSYVAHLEFRDAHGLEARFHCYQRLRILDPELFLVAHRIWGDGDQLAAFVSPGAEPIRITADDGTYTVVSALEHSATAGDEIELHSIREIRHGFKDSSEWWEYVPLTPTERARVSIRFPLAKNPDLLRLSSNARSQTGHLAQPASKDLTFTVDAPPVGALYRIDWSW